MQASIYLELMSIMNEFQQFTGLVPSLPLSLSLLERKSFFIYKTDRV